MVSRQNSKIVLSAAVCSAMLLLSGCAMAPMGEYGESFVEISGSHTGYYDNFTAGTEDGGYMIQGTAHLGSDSENSIVRMSAEEEQTAMVEGGLDCKKGCLRLVYAAADGTETVIAECEDASYEAFDVRLTVTEEESALRLSGNGSYEICDFEIFIAGDGIRFNLGSGGKENGPETTEPLEAPDVPEAPDAPEVPDVPEIPEVIDVPEVPEAPVLPAISSPITDNWPESIRCTADGLNGEPFSFELPIDAPMTLSLSCVTEGGRLRIQIKDSGGKVIFDEKKIHKSYTEDFRIPIDDPDTYTVFVWAEQYTGKFEIEPDSISE